jgi:hypothetical protein
MQVIATGNATYLNWARTISSIIGKRLSKQAVFERMNKAWVATVKALVAEVIKEQACHRTRNKLFMHFGNIWLHDSTTLHLPSLLFKKYQGVTVQGKKKATAKLNIIVDAVTGFCPLMSWSGFRTTEQKLAPDIMSIAKPKDLIIRDLGYFVLPVFNVMNAAGIYFLSRWKNRTKLYATNGEQINLRSLLKGKQHIDIQLFCGQKELVEVRFVAIKLPAAVANERRRKAKADRHRDVNHDKLYYFLLGYSIYITNVQNTIWNYKQVAEAYAVRWQVEILFKSWKSGFYIDELIPYAASNAERIESILYLILLYLTWHQTLVYEKVRTYCLEKDVEISILQLAKWSLANTMRWLTEKLTKHDKQEILYYCCYDTRRRLNAVQRFKQFFDP